MNPVISLNNISKAYRLGHKVESGQTLAETLTGAAASSWGAVRALGARLATRRPGTRATDPTEFWALQDVSFDVAQGEVVGIIGRNGAGKTTLLKVLSRVTEPTRGRAVVRGRLASLLEVGTGFHPQLSGRENIFLNGAVLGMSRREVKRKFDEIVAFAGVEQFLDTPVKRYSSGMYVRLAFAVAAHLEPDILILDEVLAVGDAGFQKKCLGKLGTVARSGRTVLLVSHNMANIQSLCSRAVLLANGRVQLTGDPASVMRAYLQSYPAADEDPADLASHRIPGMLPVIRDVVLCDGSGEQARCISTGAPLTIEIHYDSPVPLDSPVFGVFCEGLLGEPLFHLQTMAQHPLIESLPRRGVVRCHVPSVPLVPGTYYLSFNCSSLHIPNNLDFLQRAVTIDIEAADLFGTGRLPPPQNGPFLLRANWTFPTAPAASANGVAAPTAAV